MGTPPKKLRPTPPPSGPALVRPAVGVLLLTLGGAAGMACTKHNKPPMHEPQPPMVDPGYPPMNVPMEDPPTPETSDDSPMPEPPPEDPPMHEPVPPMPDPG